MVIKNAFFCPILHSTDRKIRKEIIYSAIIGIDAIMNVFQPKQDKGKSKSQQSINPHAKFLFWLCSANHLLGSSSSHYYSKSFWAINYMKFGSAETLTKASIYCIKIEGQEQRIELCGKKSNWKNRRKFNFSDIDTWRNYMLSTDISIWGEKHLIDWLKTYTYQIF